MRTGVRSTGATSLRARDLLQLADVLLDDPMAVWRLVGGGAGRLPGAGIPLADIDAAIAILDDAYFILLQQAPSIWEIAFSLFGVAVALQRLVSSTSTTRPVWSLTWLP